jgi:enoyl-CoA hydratase/carnithine racemase
MRCSKHRYLPLACPTQITMILPADIRIVSETAKLALPFVKRGITLEGMSGYILPRLVGHSSE